MMKKAHSSRNLLKGKDLSLQQISRISTMLDSQQHHATDITKQIQNQVHLGKKNDQMITKTIQKINQHGQSFVNRYEEQKEKYQKLQFLVKYFEEEIYKSKMQKANDLKNKIQTDKLVQYSNCLEEKQKQLQKIFEKTNTSSYDLSKKLDAIRALRSQRTIVSTLFDKIQRELCNLEHCYKILVIEHKRQDDIWQETINQFNQYENSGYKEIVKMKQKSQKLRIQGEEGKSNIKMNTLVHEDRRLSIANQNYSEFVQNTTRFATSQVLKEKERVREKVGKIQNDLQNVQREKVVKNAFNLLGIGSVKDLPVDVQTLENGNEVSLRENDKLYEEIIQAQEKISNLNKKPENKTEPSLRMTQFSRKKQSKQKYLEETNKTKLELQEFKNICKILLTSINQTHPDHIQIPQFLNEQQQIIYYMGQLEKFFENSYVEPTSPQKPSRERKSPKRLTYLLTSHQDSNNMSIYQEQDLLQFAKKNLQRLDKSDRGQSKPQK